MPDMTAFFVWLSFLFGGQTASPAAMAPPPGAGSEVTAISQSARSSQSSVEEEEESIFEFWLFISNGF